MSNDLHHRLHTRLKMRHFSLLLALERHRSVSRAAEALHISQPSLTKALADIEDIFQAPLFVRTGRGVEPTPAGEVVLARARFAVADNEALQHELEGVRLGWQGRLRLGVIPYVNSTVLEAAWQHALDLRPKLSLLVHEDTTEPLLKQLRQRSLDCAICRFSSESTQDGLEQAMLYRQQPYLVVSASSARLLQRPGLDDLAGWSEMDWIFPPPTPMRRLIEGLFIGQGLRVPVPRVETFVVRGIACAMAQLPRAISILPQEMASQLVATGAAAMSAQPLPWDLPPVGLAWMRGSPKTAVIRSLHTALATHCQGLGGETLNL